MTADREIDIIARDTVFDGYFRIDRYRLRHRLHDGGMSGEMVREVFERGHAVAILPYDPRRDEVLLIEQFRIGAMAAGMNPWQIEVPAGIIGAGETPEQVAVRETAEETGLTIDKLIFVHRYLVSPGGATESVRLFCALLDTGSAGGVFGLSEEHEDIKVLPMPFAEAMALLDDGRIENGMTVIALQWLLRHRDELRAT